jgi:hypothetical protein
MSCLLISILTFVCLSIAAFGVGRPLWRWIGAAEDDRLTIVTFSIGLGLIVIGLILLALGLTGLFHVLAIGGLTIVGCCWGMVEIGFLCLHTDEKLPDLLDDPDDPDDEEALIPGFQLAPPRWLLAGVLAMAAAVCILSLLHALTPPITDGTISGPLESAKRFLMEGRITDLATHSESIRPLLVDLWYLWAVTFDGAVGAQLIHWGLGLLLTLATVALATPLLGRRWAWLAGGLVVLTPAVNQQMGSPTECVALAAFCTLGLAAWCQAMLHGGVRGWFVVAGIMAGGAWGIHDSAALLILIVAIASVWTAQRQIEHRRFLLHGGSIVVATALGIGLFCVIPAIYFHAKWGNFGNTLTSSAALPKYLGIVLLASAPGILLTRRLRGLGMLPWVALAYCSLVLSLNGDPRLLFPAIPLLSITAVWVGIELRQFPRLARWVATAALLSALACNTVLSLERLPNTLSVALGLEDRKEYLLQHEPTYRAAAVANRMLRSNDRILSQEPGTFYFDCRVANNTIIPCPTGDRSSALSIEETVRQLQHEGITHLFLVDSENGDSPLHRVADAAVPVTDYHFRTADGSVRRYRLVSLR